jgi:hypothetical protein
VAQLDIPAAHTLGVSDCALRHAGNRGVDYCIGMEEATAPCSPAALALKLGDRGQDGGAHA